MKANPLTCLITAALLLAALVSPRGFAASDTSPAQEYQALRKEWLAAMVEYGKAQSEAKTDAEITAIRRDKFPKTLVLSGRFLALAKKHPQDPVALDALVWFTGAGRETKEASEALAILARDHAASEKMSNVGSVPLVSPSPALGELLRAVLDKNPKREIQAKACRGLYDCSLVCDPQQADKYLTVLAEKFADVKDSHPFGSTMGEFAKVEIEHNKTFGIGKLAPEIEGVDLQGTKFKLSDYRGMVVVIDFWGDW